MRRFACILGLLAACGVETEDRPLEVPYLTEAIFAPACAATQCHSSFKRAADLVFDTPDHVRASLLRPGSNTLLRFDSGFYDPRPYEAKDTPPLVVWVTNIDPYAKGVGRMPYDAPLPTRDIDLLAEWIREPNAAKGITGARAIGAQCNPDLYDGLACDRTDLVRCGDDWNFAEVVQTCKSCNLVEDQGALVARCSN